MLREFALIALGSLAIHSPSLAEQPPKKGCQGFLYKAKKDRVPVYLEMDRASRVIVSLYIGEKVCYVGEQGEFVIVDWKNTNLAAKDSRVKEQVLGLVYVRKADLWASQESSAMQPKRKDFFDSISKYFYYWKSGGVPEQGVVPYNPAVDTMSEMIKSPPQSPDGMQPSTAP